MPDDRVVDLGFHRAKERGPDVRLIIEIYRIGDGRVTYDSRVEEWTPAGSKGLGMPWLRSMLRWAVLQWAREWRLGLRHRGRARR